MNKNEITLKIHDKVLARIDDRLFGQFLERASWGEPGPESALQPGTRRLQPEAVQMMKDMRIPVLRFPGGTDVDYIDWRDMVSNVPGRDPARPVTIGHTGQPITNNFGVDEYFQLRDELRCETILVVNFLDTVSKRVPLAEAAQKAAGLVAYANAPVGSRLPEGMPDWPAVRAQNGHPDPFKAEYIQIGNEWWVRGFQRQVQEGTGLTETDDLAAWYLTCLKAYVEQIQAVDPDVRIIIDGKMGQGIEQAVLRDARIRDSVAYVALHCYAPGPMDRLARDDQSYSFEKMTTEDWWNAWVAMPGAFSPQGENVGLGDEVAFAASLGYQVACTEWNWNGWGFDRIEPKPEIDWPLAAGIGAAGYIQGLLRQGDTIKLACQSMLVGSRWDITAIRVDPQAASPPYFFPQGQATMFYSRHHGERLLAVTHQGIPCYTQPISVGRSGPKKCVAFVDVVVTASGSRVFVHAINRHFSAGYRANIDFSALGTLQEPVRHHMLTGRLHREPKAGQTHSVCQVQTSAINAAGTTLAVTLPARSVNTIEVQYG